MSLFQDDLLPQCLIIILLDKIIQKHFWVSSFKKYGSLHSEQANSEEQSMQPGMRFSHSGKQIENDYLPKQFSSLIPKE